MASLPPLASSVAAFAGPVASARLGLGGRRLLDLTPTGLDVVARRQWVEEHWPREASSDMLSSDRWPRGAKGEERVAALDEALVRLDAWGLCPLHAAARQRCVALCRLLLSARACVNAAISAHGGWTPLHCAAAAGDVACTRALLAARANPECQDELHRVPLELAVRARSESVQEALLSQMRSSTPLCAGDSGCAVDDGPRVSAALSGITSPPSELASILALRRRGY
eukprot:CAMPEP_0117543712 /NCGR_PEP_ID=MMETSP0784-20121206/45201_1 /TAXON_ID=39447 /ORGANISM="" /LENGTH=226 /DNA_ID=CAMNT_0005340497 /DNA_START=165 /DNA_END=846 /DNA_ORIENTATION=-